MATVKECKPEAKIEGVSVQKMIQHIDYELILGAKKDKEFGSVILFGLGGITTELYKDFAIGLPPLNQILARRLMEETKAYKMIQGFRGKTPVDIRQLEQVIVSFSNLIVDFPEIAEMDINPIAVADGKVHAIDARIIIDPEAINSSTPYPHLVITPYPTRYIVPWKLNDGADVLLRPIKPEDEPLESEMLKSLSELSLKQRFFEYIKDIPHEMLTRFCNINYEREMAIVAVLHTDKGDKLIGISRLINDPDNKSGEFAVVVQDKYQNKGLGYKLIDMLIGIGAEKGLERMYGTVLTSNNVMIQLCEKLGFLVTGEEEGNSRVELHLK
jgi:acetyltransferase